ncbi:MAG: hypothetical protein ACLFTL_09640 [Alphaproteobacteria bacterium]
MSGPRALAPGVRRVGKLDAGTLKLEATFSIVAISSVHPSRACMNAADTPEHKRLWLGGRS